MKVHQIQKSFGHKVTFRGKPSSKFVSSMFGHKLIGTKRLKVNVCRSVLLLPDKSIKYVTKHCWFVGSFTDGWAFTLRHNDLRRGECLIFLSDELMQQDVRQIRWTILHEIGHVMLKHRNSIGFVQTKMEVKMQEKEADEFVINILKNK